MICCVCADHFVIVIMYQITVALYVHNYTVPGIKQLFFTAGDD